MAKPANFIYAGYWQVIAAVMNVEETDEFDEFREDPFFQQVLGFLDFDPWDIVILLPKSR